MTADDIRQIIRRLFLQGDQSIPIADDLDFTTAGICDSFALLELATEVEKDMGGNTVPDSDVTVDNFGSIERILAYRAVRRA